MKREGFENTFSDIKNTFFFLIEKGFIIKNERDEDHICTVFYLNNKFWFRFTYEFMEEVFNFIIGENNHPENNIPVWQLLEKMDKDFDYAKAKPNLITYKLQLSYIALFLKKHLNTILSQEFSLNKYLVK